MKEFWVVLESASESDCELSSNCNVESMSMLMKTIVPYKTALAGADEVLEADEMILEINLILTQKTTVSAWLIHFCRILIYFLNVHVST